MRIVIFDSGIVSLTLPLGYGKNNIRLEFYKPKQNLRNLYISRYVVTDDCYFCDVYWLTEEEENTKT